MSGPAAGMRGMRAGASFVVRGMSIAGAYRTGTAAGMMAGRATAGDCAVRDG